MTRKFVMKALALVCMLILATFPIIRVKVTAYAPDRRLCDSSPEITASGIHLKRHHAYHVIALSDDLARRHKFGETFKLIVDGKEYIVIYEDRMARRMRNTVDLLLPSYGEAKRFGVRWGILMPLEERTKRFE